MAPVIHAKKDSTLFRSIARAIHRAKGVEEILSCEGDGVSGASTATLTFN